MLMGIVERYTDIHLKRITYFIVIILKLIYINLLFSYLFYLMMYSMNG